MRTEIFAAAAALALSAILVPASARADEALGVNSFAGASGIATRVGQEQGFFHAKGLEVTLSHPKGSVDQFKGLVEGRYQVLITALDNVVAYHDGHGEADLGGPLDLVAVTGGDSGFLSLIAAPGTKSVAELRGKTMVVDALTTGFSFALQELLAEGGVPKDAVQYVTAGSSGARLAALTEGKAQGALLSIPFDLAAKNKGFVALETVAGRFGHYAATVTAVRRGWAKDHGATIVGFIEAYRQSVRWFVAPDHKTAALALMHGEMPSVAEAELPRIYAILADRRTGLSRDLALDRAGAERVLELRKRYAAPEARPAHPLKDYVDTSYLRKAQK
ncbi:MAG TPA: ABC transporter substrate-binding protein [Stellaceae bacterium]|nr:ABC transporter substrate-binding protein [Stellaceae bacterium]